ncbi:hypothetical protein BB559_002451 [Furculomyces boomerangus]|uniref:Uncharacterized protein n=2 Tax=Harpellales TaxID=61421 RepID=A0A2T9YCQ1_9FUNG|nr:hypothetical protein BB559_004785 [Furculomyces boomerangus]PVU91490.1 hypothetical protein BB559_004087 [Furculomyces boomerangus]PVU96269.1 hypothetical protein BB559_002451 [Furculomyces boomerangus]PVZ97420.1 hypothetical protein BB558_006587 [Smittium angustum]PVZ99324.1 hypothetical protein BB558_004677 [Smittium angustum]
MDKENPKQTHTGSGSLQKTDTEYIQSKIESEIISQINNTTPPKQLVNPPDIIKTLHTDSGVKQLDSDLDESDNSTSFSDDDLKHKQEKSKLDGSDSETESNENDKPNSSETKRHGLAFPSDKKISIVDGIVVEDVSVDKVMDIMEKSRFKDQSAMPSDSYYKKMADHNITLAMEDIEKLKYKDQEFIPKEEQAANSLFEITEKLNNINIPQYNDKQRVELDPKREREMFFAHIVGQLNNIDEQQVAVHSIPRSRKSFEVIPDNQDENEPSTSKKDDNQIPSYDKNTSSDEQVQNVDTENKEIHNKEEKTKTREKSIEMENHISEFLKGMNSKNKRKSTPRSKQSIVRASSFDSGVMSYKPQNEKYTDEKTGRNYSLAEGTYADSQTKNGLTMEERKAKGLTHKKLSRSITISNENYKGTTPKKEVGIYNSSEYEINTTGKQKRKYVYSMQRAVHPLTKTLNSIDFSLSKLNSGYRAYNDQRAVLKPKKKTVTKQISSIVLL